MDAIYDQMESVTLDDDTDPYTDPCQNYCRIQHTVTFLTTGGRVTEEWMDEHRLHILKYHVVFPNFSQTNPDIDDPDFRKIAHESEVLLSNLVQSIRVNRFFSIKFYLMLNQHMLKMCQVIFSEDELESFMSKLSI